MFNFNGNEGDASTANKNSIALPGLIYEMSKALDGISSVPQPYNVVPDEAVNLVFTDRTLIPNTITILDQPTDNVLASRPLTTTTINISGGHQVSITNLSKFGATSAADSDTTLPRLIFSDFSGSLTFTAENIPSRPEVIASNHLYTSPTDSISDIIKQLSTPDCKITKITYLTNELRGESLRKMVGVLTTNKNIIEITVNNGALKLPQIQTITEENLEAAQKFSDMLKEGKPLTYMSYTELQARKYAVAELLNKEDIDAKSLLKEVEDYYSTHPFEALLVSKKLEVDKSGAKIDITDLPDVILKNIWNFLSSSLAVDNQDAYIHASSDLPLHAGAGAEVTALGESSSDLPAHAGAGAE